MKNKMKNKLWIISVLTLMILFIMVSVTFKIFLIEILPAQFIGALLGVVITVIITAFLLSGQSLSEEAKERNVKIFEKKQEVYHNFLEELQKIVQHGKIDYQSFEEANNENSNNYVDELKKLIFQLGFLKLHTDEKNVTSIFSSISNIFKDLRKFNTYDVNNKRDKISNYYSNLSDELFSIISLLKKDLYGNTDEKEKEIEKQQFLSILESLDIEIERKILDKKDYQICFWEGLLKQFKDNNFPINEKWKYENEVSEYYANKKSTEIGTEFVVYNSGKHKDSVVFYVEIGNTYCYGFSWKNSEKKDKGSEKYNELKNITQSIDSRFNDENTTWFNKKPDKYELDFWKCESAYFEKIKNINTRQIFIKEVADEMLVYIKRFEKQALEKYL